jgi:cytochrome c5
MTVVLFVLFWVILGVGLAYVALRGGARGARESLHTQSPRARQATGVVFAILFVGLGIVVPGLLLTGNHANASDSYHGVKLNAADRKGRDVFEVNCGGCHTLAAAHAQGTVGPNLDDLKPPKSLILDALAHGRLRGNGNMPANIVQGPEAQEVADFVSKVAGH